MRTNIQTYSFPQLITFGHVIDSSFSQYSKISGKNLEKNDISFESPNIELLESGEKLGMASPRGWPRPLN